MEDITTGRLGLMEIYHKFIVSNPRVAFFGVGLHDFMDKVLVKYQVATHVPHNGIQELIVAWGIPGVFLFGLLWLAMILRARTYHRKLTMLNFVPFLIILVKVQAGQMLDSTYTMIAFSYAYLSLAYDFGQAQYPIEASETSIN